MSNIQLLDVLGSCFWISLWNRLQLWNEYAHINLLIDMFDSGNNGLYHGNSSIRGLLYGYICDDLVMENAAMASHK